MIDQVRSDTLFTESGIATRCSDSLPDELFADVTSEQRVENLLITDFGVRKCPWLCRDFFLPSLSETSVSGKDNVQQY